MNTIKIYCGHIFYKKFIFFVKKCFLLQKILHIIYVRDKACGAGAVTSVLHQRTLAYRWEYGRCRNADT